tara:strand:- start:122 stop:2059 length:1938 start_codon:yes stop_codon:yes gene_type:complete
MCGFAGLVSNSISSEARKIIVSRMLPHIENRGPDRLSILKYENSTIGFARLSIRSLNNGDQPLFHKLNQTVSVTNGEIYNYQYLRKKYYDSEWTTLSDCEALHNAYDHGNFINQLPNISGMFSSVIYDKKYNEVNLLRDRTGQKPLFYALDDDKNLIFSSSLKAIAASGLLEIKIDEEDFQFILFNEYAPIGKSGIRKIKSVKPGELVKWKIGSRNFTSNLYWHWEINRSEIENRPTSRPLESNVLNALKKSIKEELCSDVPLGILLSSGIDSSLIASLAVTQTNKKIDTFNVSFDDKSLDESRIATEIASKLGTNHTQINFDKEDIPELIKIALSKLDIPLGDSSYIPTFLLCKMVSKTHKCVLAGDGGDELFGGYPTYRAHRILNLYESLMPQVLRGYILKNINSVLPISNKNINLKMKIERFLSGRSSSLVKRHFMWMSTMYNFDLLNRLMLNKLLPNDDMFLEIESLISVSGIKDPISAAQFLDLNNYLPGSIHSKTDNASMMNGVEVRSPFVNKNMLKITSNIPSRYNVNLFNNKKILRKIAKKILPIEMYNLPKKGFNFNVSYVIKNYLANDIKSKIYSLENIIDTKFALSLLQEHISGINNNRKIIWTIYSLGYWWENIQKIVNNNNPHNVDYEYIER